MKNLLALVALLVAGGLTVTAATYNGTVGPYQVQITEPTPAPSVVPSTPKPTVAPTAIPTAAPTTAQTPAPGRWLGYVSFYWGDAKHWTINCDAPSYYPPNTCLTVDASNAVQSGGPALAVGEFVEMYASSASASGLVLTSFTTATAPWGGSPLPNGYGATPSPTSAPTAKPTTAPTTAPTATPTTPASTSGFYSTLFAATSPLRMTVAQHKANGAQTLAASAMTSLWNQGRAYQPLGDARQFPIYLAKSSDPLVTISCSQYGGQCYGTGTKVHVPSTATHQQVNGGDNHIIVVDPTLGLEWDGWQCANATASCSWGSLYTLGSSGIHGPGNHPGSEGVHGGYAIALFSIQPGEIAQGHIDHALGFNTVCLNNPTVYPADTAAGGTDSSCGGTGPPSYGDLLHLTWTPAQIAASAYSTSCKVVLTALATYGGYTYDDGNTPGIELQSTSSLAWTSNGASDPWAPIRSDMKAAGDSDGTSWGSCLNRLSASSFELLQIKAGSY